MGVYLSIDTAIGYLARVKTETGAAQRPATPIIRG